MLGQVFLTKGEVWLFRPVAGASAHRSLAAWLSALLGYLLLRYEYPQCTPLIKADKPCAQSPD